MYSNCCCSCSIEPEIIKVGQSSHKLYSNKTLNFQESTTILNACIKKFGNLLKAPRISDLKIAKSEILTKFEQGRIFELQRRDLLQRAIANEIGRCRTVIANFIKILDTYTSERIKRSPQ